MFGDSSWYGLASSVGAYEAPGQSWARGHSGVLVLDVDARVRSASRSGTVEEIT